MPRQTPTPRPTPAPIRPGASPLTRAAGPPDDDPDAEFAAWLGERLRRVALGATAALLTARAYWPSEPDLRVDAGGGLAWVLAMLVVAALAVAAALIGGTLRLRWSWVDAALIALVALVALSAGHAAERRAAINLAWEWVGFGLAYLLVRNLPRTRGESVALAGSLAAAAVAVSVYGLYQVRVELPEVQRKFLANREEALRVVGIDPGSSAARSFEKRLLFSNEAFSTFGLANSLAGFVVGPLVVMLALAWDNLTRRDGRGSRASALALAVPPLLVVLVCLILTKSRSAWVGLTVAMLVLAWRERRRVRLRTLAIGAAGAVAVVAGLVAVGMSTERLDRLVLTESEKSLRYRLEYWVGAWRAIQHSPRSFWGGYGPGNFLAPYLRYKLPRSSEEINDPHNLVLEVWATAGVWAVAALGAAVALALWNTFGPATLPAAAGGENGNAPPLGPTTRHPDRDAPPASPWWLVVWAGGGWVAVLLVGQLRLIEGGGFDRWLILGAAWALAVACGLPLWRRRPFPAEALGAAALALLVNLTAAGGIGIPAVALALWTMLALGLNLRDDRPCGRLREPGGRLPAFGLAALLAALVGTFVGHVTPFWKAEAAMADAEDALRARPPAYERAQDAYERAQDADRFSARPWLALAALDYRVWMERGAKSVDLRWQKIPIEMLKAVSPPRATNSWSRHRQRAQMTSLLLKQIGNTLTPKELTKYRANVVEASRTAARLYPTNASLRAWLAEASAEIGMIPDALQEGREALRLDAITPHADKKLDPEVRLWLESHIPGWEEAAAQSPLVPEPTVRPKSDKK